MSVERVAYTVAEVAQMLGVPRSTVREWTANGTITTLRIGRRVLVPAANLHELIASRTQKGRTA